MGQLDSRMTALDTERIVMPPIRFAGAKDFAEPGDHVVGALVHYHSTMGAETFDRSAECGVLMIHEPNGIVKIALDKGQLATEVHNAMAISRFKAFGLARMMVKITYEGTHEKGYKLFKVDVGCARNGELYDSLFGFWRHGQQTQEAIHG